MEIGKRIIFVHLVDGDKNYLNGTFKELLPNGKFLVETDDKVEFELELSDINN